MTWTLSITGHTDAPRDEILADAQGAIDSLRGAIVASLSGTDGAGAYMSASLLPTPAPVVVDDTDPVPDELGGEG